MIAPWAYKPVAMSVAATPTLHGGPFGSPVLGIAVRYGIFYRHGNEKQCSHVHQTSFSLNDYIIASGCLIRTRLSIACDKKTRIAEHRAIGERVHNLERSFPRSLRPIELEKHTGD